MRNLIFFKRKDRDAKMKEGEDMLKHINKHQEIVDQLVSTVKCIIRLLLILSSKVLTTNAMANALNCNIATSNYC